MSRISIAESNAILDARSPQYNSGYLRIYSGSRPAGPDTALSGNTLLLELRYNATAFGAASNRVATANAIAAGTVAATGTASFARAFKSDGTTALADYSVGLTIAGGGTGSEEVLLGRVALVANDVVTPSSVTRTQPIGT